MHSIKLFISVLLISAVTILALPAGIKPQRSVPSVNADDLANAELKARTLGGADSYTELFIRTPIDVQFKHDIPAEHHEAIRAKVQAYHDALPADHEHKNAAYAHVYKGWHSEGSSDTQEHATANFYKTGARNSKNKLGSSVHVYQRRALGDDTEVFSRTPIDVQFKHDIPAEHHEAIRAKVQAYHDALPADHEHKNAAYAHVYKGWHSEGSSDTQEHATANFYKTGARNSKNKLGSSVHVYQRRALGDDTEVFSRTPIEVEFKHDIPADQHEAIKAKVQAYHAALPDGHEHKNAVYAQVYKGWHTEGSTDTQEHATANFYKAGARNSKNKLGSSVHVHKD